MKKLVIVAMMGMLAGCLDVRPYYMDAGVEITRTGKPCNVKKGTMSEKQDIAEMEARGLVVMGECNLSHESNAHALENNVMKVGTEKGALEARWYVKDGGYKTGNGRRRYDYRVLFFGIPKQPELAGEETEEATVRGFEEIEKLATLNAAVEMDYHPIKGETFKHYGRNLTVFQTFEKGEIVDGGIEVYTVLANESGVAAIYGLAPVFKVISTYRYCNSEYLRPGIYTYVGTDSYKTKDDRINTVRVFVEYDENLNGDDVQ